MSLHSRTGSNNSSLCKMLQKLKLPTSVIFLHYHHPKPHQKKQQTSTPLRYFFEVLVWGKWRGASIIIICHLKSKLKFHNPHLPKKSSSTHTLLFCFRTLSCLCRLFLVPEVRVIRKTGPLRAGKLHKNNSSSPSVLTMHVESTLLITTLQCNSKYKLRQQQCGSPTTTKKRSVLNKFHTGTLLYLSLFHSVLAPAFTH